MHPPFVTSEFPPDLKKRLLQFASGLHCCVLLDSNSNSHPVIPLTGVNYDFIFAGGVDSELSTGKNSKINIQEFIDSCISKGKWVFGYISYDYKNQVEKLHSGNDDHVEFPLLHFFSPEYLVISKDSKVEIYSGEIAPFVLWKNILETTVQNKSTEELSGMKRKIRKSDYLKSFEKIREHIQRGDIYEVNFCQEFYAHSSINPIGVYEHLMDYSPNPFACFYKLDSRYLICSSPERFLNKNGNRLISQPIKGTAPRGNDQEEDRELEMHLKTSQKERSENVMIVDLVRNDLAKVAEKGTVKVDELFGVYKFPRVHQMISTISCNLKKGNSFMDVIHATFPMGSMTGTPKHRAMQIIEELESTRRGIYSGTVGYISPNGTLNFSAM